MNVEAASQQLVHEVLAMIICKVLSRVDNPVHIGLHQIRNDVDIFIARLCWWLLNVHKPNNILVIKEL